MPEDNLDSRMTRLEAQVQKIEVIAQAAMAVAIIGVALCALGAFYGAGSGYLAVILAGLGVLLSLIIIVIRGVLSGKAAKK